uniref:Uncharacterized protein n=1 Tax=viral metagenome TaxID=1070528 RepID=A0A6C0AFA6_9ZZZZ
MKKNNIVFLPKCRFKKEHFFKSYKYNFFERLDKLIWD